MMRSFLLAVASLLFAALAARAADAPYVSRGDDSRTHKREQALMKKAGLDPAIRWKATLRTGQRMRAALQVAGGKRAYALPACGNFQSFDEKVPLAPVFDARTPDLRNVYAVPRPNAAKLPAGRVDEKGGTALAAHLASPGVARQIGAATVARLESDGVLVLARVAWGDVEFDTHVLARRELGHTPKHDDGLFVALRTEDVHVVPAAGA